jgi:hypothetical protein
MEGLLVNCGFKKFEFSGFKKRHLPTIFFKKWAQQHVFLNEKFSSAFPLKLSH